MKRFYKDVTLGGGAAEGVYTLLLDGKPVQTPARQELKVLSMPWAERIADEWRAQGDEIVPDSMPLSQMAMTLIDRVVPQRTILAKEISQYLDTDLICYRAVEPEMVRHAQEEKWNPFLDWFEQNTGIHLSTTTGLVPLVQSPMAHEKIAEALARMTDAEFMAAYLATIGSGSVVMALAFVAGDVSPEQILAAAFAEERVKDEIYLADQYGVAPDQERRYRALASDLAALQEILMLCSAS